MLNCQEIKPLEKTILEFEKGFLTWLPVEAWGWQRPKWRPSERGGEGWSSLAEPRPRVNFTNILRAAFMHANPKSAKIQSNCQSFLSFCAIFTHKMLVKLTPELHPERVVGEGCKPGHPGIPNRCLLGTENRG